MGTDVAEPYANPCPVECDHTRPTSGNGFEEEHRRVSGSPGLQDDWRVNGISCSEEGVLRRRYYRSRCYETEKGIDDGVIRRRSSVGMGEGGISGLCEPEPKVSTWGPPDALLGAYVPFEVVDASEGAQRREARWRGVEGKGAASHVLSKGRRGTECQEEERKTH